ncbi:MAG TPA: response regulator [Gaiellaceae bacterium]|nr:response regulator [Gaiellaceae bacterium]
MQEAEMVGGATSPPRVLVVDDDPAIRLICSTWLSLDGYDVLEAADGQDALELALTAAPDIVLLDLSLPVLDGFAVAAAMQADERTREVPLVVLTAEVDPSISERVGEMGAAGLFTKPFDPSTVAAFVRGVIDELSGTRRQTPAGGHAF